MQIHRDAKLLGYATVSQWLLPSGGKTVEMRMELMGQSGASTKLHKISSYDAKGHPTRMVLEVNGGSRTETIVTFGDKGANVSRVVHGIAKNSLAPLAPGAPWGDGTEFWFIRDHPKIGEKVQAFLFSIDKLDWVLTTVTYVGLKGPDNAVRSDSDGRSTTAFLDGRGNPVRIELGDGITMSQIVPTHSK
jgi:hypothetical protein